MTRVPELAALEPRAWRARGLPPLGLDQLVPQARALQGGEVTRLRPVELPGPARGSLLLHLERDPLESGEVTLLAWARLGGDSTPEGVELRVMTSPASRADAAAELLAVARRVDGPVFHFAGTTAQGLGALGASTGLPLAEQSALEERLWNLLTSLRRAAAFLPVHRYSLAEVAAVLEGEPAPLPGAEEPAFVAVEHLRRGSPGPWADVARAAGERELDRLATVLRWLLAQPHRAPRRRR